MHYLITKVRLISFIIVLLLVGCGKSTERRFNEAERVLSTAKSSELEQKFTDAISLYKDAISLFNELKRDSIVGQIYLLLARCQRSVGEYDSSVTNYQHAAFVFNKLGEKKLARKSEIELAWFYLSLKQSSASISIAENSAATAKVFSDSEDIFEALSCAVEAYHAIGNHALEIRTLQNLLDLDSVFYRSQHKCTLLEKQIVAHELRKQPDQAGKLFEHLKIYAESINDPQAVVRAYYIWGYTQQLSARYNDAFKAFSMALGRMEKRVDKRLQADVLSSLGCLAYRSDHLDDARRYFNDALILVREIDDPVYENMLKLISIAIDGKLTGKRIVSRESDIFRRCSASQAACRQMGYRLGEAFAMFIQASMLDQNDTTQEAFHISKRALEKFEQLSDIIDHRAIESKIVNVFLEGENSDWHHPILRFHCKRNEFNEAFEVNENSILADIRNFYTRLSMQTQDHSLNQLIEKLRWKHNCIRLIERDIVDEISKGKKASYERLLILQERILRFQEDIYSINDELRMLRTNFQYLLSPGTLSVKEIQDSLLSNEALIEYISLSDVVYILVITKDTNQILQTEIQSKRLQSYVDEYNRLLSDPRFRGASERADELSSVIGEILLKPLIHYIENSNKLYIVPANEFDYLPIHTLKVKGDPIIEEFDISYLPTAAALLFSRKEEKPIHDIVGIGHPGRTDWDVDYELKDIRSFYDSAKILVAEYATLQSLEAVEYDVLHITAEFHLNRQIPDNSIVLLSDGKTETGFKEVTLGEVFSITPAQVLIFANISSTPGELMKYAPLGLLANGTPTLIAAMWQGDRRVRRYFDEVFYTSLKNGSQPAVAYRDAIISMRESKEFSDLHECRMFYRFGR
ncbi:MAG: CHAT domain-containing protein [Ignavibacteriales bacterium]|nr:CHAT domain-containing protein [Ignavibacteriales bacterium]